MRRLFFYLFLCLLACFSDPPSQPLICFMFQRAVLCKPHFSASIANWLLVRFGKWKALDRECFRWHLQQFPEWIQLLPAVSSTELNSAPPRPQIHAHLEPVNVTLLGYRVFADLINFKWGRTRLGLALNPMTDVFIRRKTFKDTEETETQREDGHMKVKAEIGVMQQQAQECQGLVASTRS